MLAIVKESAQGATNLDFRLLFNERLPRQNV